MGVLPVRDADRAPRRVDYIPIDREQVPLVAVPRRLLGQPTGAIEREIAKSIEGANYGLVPNWAWSLASWSDHHHGPHSSMLMMALRGATWLWARWYDRRHAEMKAAREARRRYWVLHHELRSIG